VYRLFSDLIIGKFKFKVKQEVPLYHIPLIPTKNICFITMVSYFSQLPESEGRKSATVLREQGSLSLPAS
jgi:hypothetical protein